MRESARGSLSPAVSSDPGKRRCGGAKDLLSGRTSRRHVRCFAGIISRICQPISVFTILRLPEAREAQAELAREHGISGFCYYHYWFKRNAGFLSVHFKKYLESGRPEFPFCLCWANEPWSRRWLGEEQDILIAQTYSREDDEAHSEYLSSVFSDERYITVGNRPVFLLYRPDRHPDPIRFTTFLKNAARRATGNEPYLVAVRRWLPEFRRQKVWIRYDTALRAAA